MRIRITDRMVKTLALVAYYGVININSIMDRSKGAYTNYQQVSSSMETMVRAGYVERVDDSSRVSYRLSTAMNSALRNNGEHIDEGISKMAKLTLKLPFMKDVFDVSGGADLRFQLIERLISDARRGVAVDRETEVLLNELLVVLDCQQ